MPAIIKSSKLPERLADNRRKQQPFNSNLPKKPITTPKALADEFRKSGKLDGLRKQLMKDFNKSVSSLS
jgi:hypothetical protein